MSCLPMMGQVWSEALESPGAWQPGVGPENQNHGCGQWGLAGWGGNSGDHDAGFAEEESHTLYRFATVDS